MIGANRAVRRAILSIARKNGKTMLIAGIVLAHLIGPEAVMNGEIYSAANDREQAAQVYKAVAQIVRADPELDAAQGGALRCIDSTKNVSCYSNGSFYRALSSESGTKHGLNPTLVIYDELSQAKSRELFDVLDTSMGARDDPLLIVISTQSNDPKHIMSEMIDDGLNANDPTIVCHLYQVPDDEAYDVFDEKNWRLANPALGDFRSLDDMRAVADKASRSPSDEPKFRNLYCNQRVDPTSSLIARKEWLACAGEAVLAPGEEIYLALDLSSVNDLTALVAGSNGAKTRVQCFAWKPKPYLVEHSDRDFGHGSRRYAQWAASEPPHLLTTPGRTIDPEVVAKKIGELCSTYRVLGLAYDLWRIKDITKVFDSIGLETWLDTGSEKDRATKTGLRLVPWGQGFRDMGPAVEALEREVLDRALVHPSNEVLTWCVGNARALTDPAGNKKLDKEAARFRIDPAVAMAMMVGLKSRDRKVAEKPLQFIAV